ncbi:MAG: hypothetical protein ACRD0P_24550, partial [Stackebrandtia sp.]
MANSWSQPCRVMLAARPMPTWASHGPGPVAVLVWLPFLLLDPLGAVLERSSAAAWSTLAGITILYPA